MPNNSNKHIGWRLKLLAIVKVKSEAIDIRFWQRIEIISTIAIFSGSSTNFCCTRPEVNLGYFTKVLLLQSTNLGMIMVMPVLPIVVHLNFTSLWKKIFKTHIGNKVSRNYLSFAASHKPSSIIDFLNSIRCPSAL